MADWFKLQENWFVEPRLQWAIREQQSVVTVWLWCLTECCRIGSDTIGLHQEDFEMIGIQQLLNLSPGIFVSGINLLEKIRYIQVDRTKNSLKVVKWTEFQSEYLSRKNKGDYDKNNEKRTKNPKVSDIIGEPPPEERRVEEIRGEKKKEEYSEGFLKAWNEYPNKSGKLNAYKAWKALKPDEDVQNMILKAISIQKTWPSWTKDQGKFIPHFSTWMNQMRWEDEGLQKLSSKTLRPSYELPNGNQ